MMSTTRFRPAPKIGVISSSEPSRHQSIERVLLPPSYYFPFNSNHSLMIYPENEMKKSIHSVCSPLLSSPFNQSIVGYLIESQPVVKHVLLTPLLGRLHDDYPRYPVAHEQTEAHCDLPAPAAAAVLPVRCCHTQRRPLTLRLWM